MNQVSPGWPLTFRFPNPRMKSSPLFLLALGLLLSGARPAALAAPAPEEPRLIGVLRSDAPPAEKDAACAQLKRIGTDRAIPALAALLPDEQLSHSARYALESMRSRKAGRALVKALARTSGLTKAGIINSIGNRGETRAVAALAKLLADPEADIAAAVASALGQIGGAQALQALQAAAANTTGALHDACVDGCLRCADRLRAAGSRAQARAAFQHLYDTGKKDSIRTAAYRGLIQTAGDQALPLITSALTGQDRACQSAALELARQVQAPEATRSLAALLPTVAPPMQAALIESLAQREDAAAAPAILRLTDSPAPEVRVAALNALGILGGASAVPPLAAAAASGGEAQAAAWQALIRLRRGQPTEMMLGLLPEARPEVQAELARALGNRRDLAAIPRLMELARQDASSASHAALLALAGLVDDAQMSAMVQFVVAAGSDRAREQAAEAVNAACHQILARRGRVNLEPISAALARGTPETRIALLPVCGGLIDPLARAALRAAVAAPDPPVRAAAIRALCDTPDPELLADALQIACEAPEENLRTLAIRACVRLTTQEEAIRLPRPEQIAPLKTILARPLRPEQQRAVLAGLAEIPDRETLALAEPMLDEAATQREAAQAIIKIASRLPCAQRIEATNVLAKVRAVLTDADARKEAETLLKTIQADADYIIAWQVAGPYFQEGQDYKALFDLALPPENPDAKEIQWRALPPDSDPKRPWVMDLLQALGGDQRVAYARTWIYSQSAQPARLDLGSDDGIKVWLNHQVVHALNTFRGLEPDADKVKVNLRAGWNPLLLKITQLNQGWGFCARLRQPDGTRLDGLKFSASPPAPAAARAGK
ncbi:MAG: hypothetical protein BWX68_02766 [Verrucomicrobia bacterium ADurb.Bin063]|jgi:HEAT repeat protein|nr:MAG: hypothetical protein BWX68_02766 [Verrucomicrobia bacterium ADurb.Bin063]